LIFTFAKNNYFNETVIKKSVYMKQTDVIDSTESTAITWKDGCNPTIKKQKKKKKNKKVTVETECESFFNLFKTLKRDDEDKPSADNEDDDEESPENDIEWNLDLSNMIKDDIIPLALEYYLGVIEAEDDDGDEDFEDADSDGEPKKDSKKKGGKGGQPKLPPGAKPEDCKQQ